VRDASHDASFRLGVLHLPPPHDLALLQHLHRVHVARRDEANEKDLTEGTLAQHAQQLEVIQPNVARPKSVDEISGHRSVGGKGGGGGGVGGSAAGLRASTAHAARARQ